MSRERNKKFMRRYRFQDGACFDCGRQYAETDLTRHHIVPLAKGGTDGGENVCLLCDDCHNKRHGTPGNKYEHGKKKMEIQR